MIVEKKLKKIMKIWLVIVEKKLKKIMKKVLFLCSLGSVFVHNVYKRKDPKRKQFASLLITLNNVCVKVCLGQLSVQPSCDTVLQPSYDS